MVEGGCGEECTWDTSGWELGRARTESGRVRGEVDAEVNTDGGVEVEAGIEGVGSKDFTIGMGRVVPGIRAVVPLMRLIERADGRDGVEGEVERRGGEAEEE